MREIKFRGIKKSPFKNEWVTGYYGLYDGEHVIIMPHAKSYEKALNENKPIPKLSVMHEIDYETLGQYTGLKDKNGKEIYEGDILRNVYYKFSNDENGNKGYKEEILKVVYRGCGFIYELIKINELEDYLGEDVNDFIEVIGNIYDNPELLEVEDE